MYIIFILLEKDLILLLPQLGLCGFDRVLERHCCINFLYMVFVFTTSPPYLFWVYGIVVLMPFLIS